MCLYNLRLPLYIRNIGLLLVQFSNCPSVCPSANSRSHSILHLRSSNWHQSTRLTTKMCTLVYVFRNSALLGRKKQIRKDAYGTQTHERVTCVDNGRTRVDYVYKKSVVQQCVCHGGEGMGCYVCVCVCVCVCVVCFHGQTSVYRVST